MTRWINAIDLTGIISFGLGYYTATTVEQASKHDAEQKLADLELSTKRTECYALLNRYQPKSTGLRLPSIEEQLGRPRPNAQERLRIDECKALLDQAKQTNGN
jgi:hypothetical protein